MLQVFYLNVAIYCRDYTHMLQPYVLDVSHRFTCMLQQMLLPTCPNLRAHIRCTHPASAAYLYHAGQLQQLDVHTSACTYAKRQSELAPLHH
jgi:hypothetical protein